MISLNPQDQGIIVLSQEDYIPLAVESFLIDRKAQSVSPETLSFYRKKRKYFLEFCHTKAVTQVSRLTPDLVTGGLLICGMSSGQRLTEDKVRVDFPSGASRWRFLLPRSGRANA